MNEQEPAGARPLPEVASPPAPARCVIVLDESLAKGKLANAAAVIALTIGQRHPELVGEALLDGSGFVHPGLIPIGIAVLASPQDQLPHIRRQGLEAGCDVVDFPLQGQQTTDYRAFREAVAALQPESIRYVGVALVGQKKIVRKIVGNLRAVK